MSKVAKATIVLMVITLLSKVLGFGRDLVLSAFYGATMYSDVYLVSLDISRVVFQVIGTVILTTYILPIGAFSTLELHFLFQAPKSKKRGYLFARNFNIYFNSKVVKS